MKPVNRLIETCKLSRQWDNAARFILQRPFSRIICFILVSWAMLGACRARGDTLPAALDDDFVVQVWDTDSGLPERIVTSIAQTPDGYLWVGTLQGGLARFDGVSFADFQPGNTPELKSIEIHNLFVDHGGTLWINNAEGGLISCRDGKFHFEHDDPDIPGAWLVKILYDHQDSLEFVSRSGIIFRRNGSNDWQTLLPPANLPLREICRDQYGAAWCLTTNGTIAQMTRNRLVFVPLPPEMKGSSINTLVKDISGRIWIGTQTGIAAWDGKTFVNMTPTNGEAAFNVEQMFPCPDGGFWVLGGKHLRKCCGQRWQAEAKLVDADESKETEPADFFRGLSGLFADSHGGIWLSHLERGIGYVYPDGRVSWVRQSRNIFTGGIRCWCEDGEGNIWIGLREGGLARLRPRIFHLVWPAAAGTADQSACSVCENSDGTMFFGTQENRVLRWDRDNDVFSLVNLPSPESFAEMKVLSAGNGRLWIGSVRGGVLELSHQQCVAPFPSRAIGGVARCLYRDRQGALWIGSEFGLFRWSDGKLKIFSARDGFTPAYVLAITGDRNGDIWFGTALGELRHFHAGKFETFLPPDSRTDQAALREAASADPFNFRKQGALSGGERFWSLHFDGDNVLWIGTLGGGLLRFEDGKFTRFTTSDGLPSDNVNQILEDQNGQLWLGTGAGIVRVAKSELDNFAHGGKTEPNFVTYDRSDGLPALECYGGSEPNCWSNHDGKLWFTTVKGAGWIDPAALQVNRRPPQVHIEEFRLDGRNQVATGFPASLPATRPPAKVTVAAGRHYYEFRFCGSGLTSPEKVKYKWQLAGLDDNWVNGGNRNIASYGFIPPGTYQFEVLACNNDGIWSETPAVMKLTVLPYFWQEWWFKVLVALIILVALLTAYSIKVSRLRMLEHLRLRIARDLHDEVGANLGSISLLAQIMKTKPSGEDAAQVHEVAAQTIDTLRDIIWFIDPTHDSLTDLVMRLQETSRIMLTSVSYTFKQEGDFLSAGLSLPFRRNVPLIFKEILHNVLKHSNASEVAITIQRTENIFQFQVRDNGSGFCPESRNSGNGIKNMKRRAKEINGQLTIESSAGQGTTITVSTPIV